MGVRRARRPRGRRVRLGRRVPAEGTPTGQYLAGRVPLREHPVGRLRGHLARGEVPAEWLRALRHDRERLGVDDRLVLGRPGGLVSMLRRRPARGERRPERPDRDPTPGNERRLTPLRAELLPPLPPGCAHGAGDRHLDEPPRLPLPRASGLTKGASTMPPDKPNILVIWGDDIGITNLSCYSDGLMGYRTPNIDRIADEGMRFTDSYGEQSCTAGRSSFITGQSVYRTGLSKVGFPGLDIGLRAGETDLAQPGPVDALPGDERRPAGGAALLAVGVREAHPLVGDPVDVRGAIPHQPVAVAAEVRDPDV